MTFILFQSVIFKWIIQFKLGIVCEIAYPFNVPLTFYLANLNIFTFHIRCTSDLLGGADSIVPLYG